MTLVTQSRFACIIRKRETPTKKFSMSVIQLTEWCKYNRIEINWNKTKIMYVTNKRKISTPKELAIENS